MSNLEEFKMYVQQRYDEYLYSTENRDISYGEIVYIQNLKRKDLESLLEEIERNQK